MPTRKHSRRRTPRDECGRRATRVVEGFPRIVTSAVRDLAPLAHERAQRPARESWYSRGMRGLAVFAMIVACGGDDTPGPNNGGDGGVKHDAAGSAVIDAAPYDFP